MNQGSDHSDTIGKFIHFTEPKKNKDPAVFIIGSSHIIRWSSKFSNLEHNISSYQVQIGLLKYEFKMAESYSQTYSKIKVEESEMFQPVEYKCDDDAVSG